MVSRIKWKKIHILPIHFQVIKVVASAAEYTTNNANNCSAVLEEFWIKVKENKRKWYMSNSDKKKEVIVHNVLFFAFIIFFWYLLFLVFEMVYIEKW